MRRLLLVLTATSLALAGAACGDDDALDAGDGSSTSSTSSPPDDGDPATEADVAIRIVSAGGFVPFGTDFASVPTVVLTDGTVFTGGAAPEIFPGPAVLPVATGTLSAAELADLLDAARAAGLDRDGIDYGMPGVTDMPTTYVRVVIDGQTHEHSAYGLTFDGAGGLGLSEDEIDGRRALTGFVDEVSAAVGDAATELYDPDAYQVLTTPADASASQQEPAPNQLDWPFADIALDQAECFDIDGDEVAAFEELLEQATQITIWRDAAGATHQLIIRARLPFEDTCP
jgi:hypothetical protein